MAEGRVAEATGAVTPDPGRWKALAVLSVAYLMVVLDVSIVNVALPSIQKDLHFSPEDLQWVVSALLADLRRASCCSAGAPGTCSGAGACS